MSRQVNFASNCEKNVPRRCCKSFSTKAQELVQQTTAENAGKQVELEEAGSFRTFFIVFRLELRNPTTWLAYEPVSMTYMHTAESPTCLANHEAKTQAQQLEEARLLAEEKYKELQVGQCVEC